MIATLAALESNGVEVRRLADATCDGAVCAAARDGALIYRDAGHLSHEGSAWLGRRSRVLSLDRSP